MLKSLNLQSFSTSGFATRGVMGICQLPPAIGLRVGRFIADLYSSQRDSKLVQAVRANQWGIRDKQSSPEQLDIAVRNVFRHAAHCYYDFYGNLGKLDKLKDLLIFTPQVEALIQRSRLEEEGALVVGPHLSNFDLVMLAIAHKGFQAQGISPEQPPGGYVIQNQIRESTGLNITPAGAQSLQKAIQRMRNGGTVFTGVDRPVPADKINPDFCGHPSNLPTGAVRLAIKADVPVIVVSSWMNADGKYQMEVSDPIPMRKYDSRTTTVKNNTEAVLEIVGQAIRKFPDQWLMYYPVWSMEQDKIP